MSAARIFPFRHAKSGPPGVSAQSLGIPAAAYPGRIATNSDLIVAVDRQQTTLLLPMGASDTSMTVLDASMIAAYNLLSIDNEIVKTTGPPAGNVVPVSRGFDGAAPAAHAANAPVLGLVDAYHHNALVAEIEAIEQTLGVNLSKVGSGPVVVPRDFGPVTSGSGVTVSGGNLVVGSNVLTFAVVPPGVNGTDTNHYLYIANGTGTPEAVLITGGSGTAGEVNGQIIITCAHAHSGAWTVQTATGGISEATWAAGGGYPYGAEIQITQDVTLHAPVTFPDIGQPAWWLHGAGQGEPIVTRATDYPAGNLFVVNASAGNLSVKISDLLIFNGGPFATPVSNTSGAAIYIGAGSLPFIVEDVFVRSGYIGLDIDGATNVSVSRFTYISGAEYNGLYPSFAGIYIHRSGKGGGFAPVSIVIDRPIISGSNSGANPPYLLPSGIRIECADGVEITNAVIGGIQKGLVLFATAGAQIDIVDLNNSLFDTFISHAIHVYGNGGTPAVVNCLKITNCHIGTRYDTNSIYNGHGVLIDQNCFITKVELYNNRIADNGLAGVVCSSGNSLTSELAMVGNDIYDNNLSNAGHNGVTLAGAITNVVFTGNHVYNSLLGGKHVAGLYINAFFTNGTIVGNDFHVVPGATSQVPVLVGGSLGNVVMRSNGAIDDVIPALALAATIAWPPNPNFTITGSGTGVTAVNMTSVPAGASGTFRTTGGAITFTAGGGIGNTFTSVQNVPVVWMWDGTAVWLK